MAETTNPPKSTLLPQPQAQTVMTQEQFLEAIKLLREPSDEEKQKRLAEAERKKEDARQSVMMAEQDLQNRAGIQRLCNHRNEKNHTFVGNNNGDGNTVAICQICLKDYKWRTTPDQIRDGVNLLDIRGLTEAHLLAWEKQWPPLGAAPDRIKLITRAGKTPE